ncbi:glycoside hydrolase family 95 protein [Butyrivibrio sp. NC2002]|uniref:glycoside hydrolase family 95 protein n=1 Tax=Butyrivibrio sp. NC2002 TaxID=1410610 RepID=UPI00068A77D7|nr:glycoside hydrolase family 95 protein [Butyrivibrio sp. NC2002]
MDDRMRLWYEKPATKWEEALPVGNGRLGAMICGGTKTETIYLNADSIWSGRSVNRINKDALKYLGQIRKLIREGKIPEAEKLSLMALSGTPNSERSYQTAGELNIYFESDEKTSDYKRELDLDEGVASVCYASGNRRIRRDFVASYDSAVMAYHMKADAGTMSFTCRLSRPNNRIDEIVAGENEIGFNVSSTTGIPFFVRVAAEVSDGKVCTIGEHLIVENSSEVTLFIDISSAFYDEDYIAAGKERIERARSLGWDNILKKHMEEFDQKFGKLKLSLGDKKALEKRNIPTDIRLSDLKKGKKDPDLFALYFQYGRYLLFSSSRGKCLPANLQGIWNNSLTPPWDSKYTININAEMNYWIAESGNLSECHMPFFTFLKRVCENGKKTAKEMYGCRGSVAHHNSDIYADTAPQDHYIPASFWVMGEAWMATHIWEHYLYTGDKDFLSDNFEVLDECLSFFEDFLIENDEGLLVTSPSVSPENVYIMKNGTRGCLCEGATMDIEILTELLNGYIGACEVLGKDDKEIERAKKILKRLPEIRIGKHGQIKEWMEDYDEQEPGHRHISHLYGVYPGSSINYEKTPRLMEAARVTLERRLANGGGHTGWSRAWIIGLWAHFLEGKKVYENLKALLCKSTFDNLMDNHPYGPGFVFQIDGNFGAAAAMLEMIAQCRDGYVRLLPALPREFSEGMVSGVKLRGGLILTMEWKNMEVVRYSISRSDNSLHGENDKITVLVNGKEEEISL